MWMNFLHWEAKNIQCVEHHGNTVSGRAGGTVLGLGGCGVGMYTLTICQCQKSRTELCIQAEGTMVSAETMPDSAVADEALQAPEPLRLSLVVEKWKKKTNSWKKKCKLPIYMQTCNFHNNKLDAN